MSTMLGAMRVIEANILLDELGGIDIIDALKELKLLRLAVEQSVYMQNYYANLLNIHLGGERKTFPSPSEWIEELKKIANESIAKDSVIPEDMKKIFEENLYLYPREIEGRGWCALRRQFTTWGLVIGIREIDNDGRFCYQNYEDALNDLNTWDGVGDPPGNWVKAKSRNRDDFNPKFIKEP